MLASHWSRGPSEIFQRSYPYNSESVNLVFFNSNDNGLVHRWLFYSATCLYRGKCPSKGSLDEAVLYEVNWYTIGSPLAFQWRSIDIRCYYWDMNPIIRIGTGLVHRWLFYSATCLYKGKCPSKGSFDEAVLYEVNWYSIGIPLSVNWHSSVL